MEYLVHLIILCGIYLILAQGFNVSFGLGRLFNLAHVASYAVGAYTAAILSVDYQVGFINCLIFSVLLSSLFSLLIGAISLRLKDDYFAIGSLAFSFIVSAVLINYKDLTRGVLGIPGIPRSPFFNFQLNDNLSFLTVLWIFVASALVIVYLITHSSFGRRLRMLSEHEHAANALGVSSLSSRNLAFVISSGYAGLAGAFFAFYLSYIDPSSFYLHEMVFVLTIVILGRPGSFIGVFLSTFFLVLLPEPLRFLDLSPGLIGPLRQMLYAIILYLTVLNRRSVLFPVKRKI